MSDTKTPEKIQTSQSRVRCDGGDTSLGHPAVYLEMGTQNQVQCPYCGRVFVRVSTAEKD